jgi:hypothetical protein
MTPTDASEVDLELGNVTSISRTDPALGIRPGDEQEREQIDIGGVHGSVGSAAILQVAHNAA